MEQNISQHTLTLDKGITTIPSDLVCPDDTLSSADGMVYLDGEYKPIQVAILALSGAVGKLKYVHCLNNGDKIYVFADYATTFGTIHFYNKDGELLQTETINNILDVRSVGNTLIVNTSDGINYYLYKITTSKDPSGKEIKTYYTYIGKKIPEPDVTFLLKKKADSETSPWGGSSTTTDDDIPCQSAEIDVTSLVNTSTTDAQLNFPKKNYSNIENAFLGIYAEAKKKVAERNGFCLPFFVRYAIELYDGTYTMVSNPILLFPSITGNTSFAVDVDGDNDANYCATLLTSVAYSYIHYKCKTDYSDWSDIVKGVAVFASKGVEVYNTTKMHSYGSWGGSTRTEGNIVIKKSAKETIDYINNNKYSTSTSALEILDKRDPSAIIEELASSSVFYHIADITYNKELTILPIKENVVTNLTTQTTLVNSISGEDYYSHCDLFPTGTETFNRRLNVFGVRRSFFEGFSQFMPYTRNAKITEEATHSYVVTVQIETPDGTKTVQKTISTPDIFSANMWFYYPDPRAKKVNINGITYTLKEHSGLNGAYYLGGLPDGTEIPSSGTETLSGDSTPEHLANYVIQSEVDNPFTFFASGYVRVGQGKILGMAGLTTALSQDAYKISTTLVFTTQGIWALKINDEGQYTSVAPPFSREVCSYPNTITMTDNAVFFVSKKGLMCVTGESESSVVCVSDQLRDSDFVTFCNSDKCYIAYDYKESLILVFQNGSSECYIYSIKTGTWTHDSQFLETNSKFLTCVTDYPDSLIQTEDYKVYSLLERKNRNNDTDNTYDGSLTTRPVKFDGSLILDSIRQLKHLVSPDVHICASKSDFEAYIKGTTTAGLPVMMLAIEGTNDLLTWHDVPSLYGKPFKFFRFTYTFKYLSATSTFAGTSFIVQKRYIEKML